jgi:hypothetical protein
VPENFKTAHFKVYFYALSFTELHVRGGRSPRGRGPLGGGNLNLFMNLFYRFP